MTKIQDNKPVAVLLVQLGTPDDPTPDAVERYLREFLSDPYVIKVNRVLWFFILNFIILPTRRHKSAALYERLFTTYGKVLLTYTKSLAEKIARVLLNQTSQHVPVTFAMRYGSPSLKNVISEMLATHNPGKIVVIPQFPQYSDTTTGSIKHEIERLKQELETNVDFDVVTDFHDEALYIESVAQLINESLGHRVSPPQRLILSYHGIPQSYVDDGDCYAEQCRKTTELLKAKINFPSDLVLHTYQSRFGKKKWLTPYTDDMVKLLADQGIHNIMVACPGFTCDCLETLDEIGFELKKTFVKAGGKTLELVSALNDHDIWATNLSKIILNSNYLIS